MLPAASVLVSSESVAYVSFIRQATNHGHEPSEGAKIDAQLQAEDKKALERKGAWGPK